jgi:hypothetical protein
MPARRLTGLSTAVALGLACSSDAIFQPPGGFAHAAATRFCGPTDGPAVAIYLSPVPVESLQPPTPYVRVAVWQPLERLAGGSWLVAIGDTAAAAWYFTAPGDFAVATSGQVTVDLVEPDTTLQGSVDLRFPSAGRVTRSFRAAWISRAPLCG